MVIFDAVVWAGATPVVVKVTVPALVVVPTLFVARTAQV
jgi:hypothetical protein